MVESALTVDFLQQHSVCDAHCHGHDDLGTLPQALRGLHARHAALMGVREDDWIHVAEAHKLAPHKVIPCFGVHPWFAHLHAPDAHRTISDLLEPTKAGAPLDLPASLNEQRPSVTWEQRLRELLAAHPASTVGEFGVDRAAVVPGTKLQTKMEHQMYLAERHLLIAADLNKPVSMHCVRGYGHLQDLFRGLHPGQVPPRVMLHSYGGSPEVVKAFTSMPKIGRRFYFSFSSVINASKGQREKLVARIRAAPDDRLLLESDQNSATRIDAGLLEILGIAAEAKGWSAEETAQRTTANFSAFYADSLAAMAATAQLPATDNVDRRQCA